MKKERVVFLLYFREFMVGESKHKGKYEHGSGVKPIHSRYELKCMIQS